MLIDSNIIIYAGQPGYHDLRRFIAESAPYVSAVSYVETLGYHKLGNRERTYLERFFAVAEVLPISDSVLHKAVILRQQRRMSLADALIAATALVHGLQLVTRNIANFSWIEGLVLLDPVAPSGH